MTVQECYEKMGEDYQEILSRFGSEAMVNRFAISFLNDPSFEQLKAGLEENDGEKSKKWFHAGGTDSRSGYSGDSGGAACPGADGIY